MGMDESTKGRWIGLVLRGRIDYPKDKATKLRRKRNKVARRSRRINRTRR